MNSIYHYPLIKIIFLHHLSLLNIPWETFIAHDMFKGHHIPPSMVRETVGPSNHVKTGDEHHETKTAEVSVFLTYQRGSRKLFAAATQVFTP